MRSLFHAETLRLMHRMDFLVAILVVPALVFVLLLIGEQNALRQISALPPDLPADARQQAVAGYEFQLLAYTWPGSLVTALGSPILVLALPYLVASAAAADFQSRTVRTWLQVSGDRLRYLASRYLSVLAIVVIVALEAVVVGASAGLAFASARPDGAAAPTLASMLLACVASAARLAVLGWIVALVAVLARSPAVGLLVGLAYQVLEPVLLAASGAGSGGPTALAAILPLSAADLLRAQASSPVLASTSTPAVESYPTVLLLLSIAAWIALSTVLAAAVFQRRDVLE